MYRRICCLFAVIATLLCLCVAVHATEENAGYMQLSEDMDGLVIEQDLLLDLNGHHVTNATVAEGVTLRLMDSANDEYDASKCGSFSGTVNGTVEQLVQTTADEVGAVKSYLVINQDGTYSAHRFYAGITKISLVPDQVALGYKAEYYADEVINAMVTGYGYELWINSLNPVQRMKDSNIADNELTLRLKNILGDNETINAIGATATINGNAIIRFNVDGQELTVTGADHSTTLQAAVEAVNSSLGQDRTAYTKAQIQSVRDLINKFGSYMNAWEQEYIFTEDKFVSVENVSATYGQTLTLGQVFTAVEGVSIGENVTATVNGETISVAGNWADTALTLNAGEAVITITDNERCWTATNTVIVEKADPAYEIPTGLTATYGQTLADVALPEGFAWADSTASVGNAGTQTHTAIYNAGENYNTVEVTVSVAVAKANPTYTVPTDLTATYGQTLADVALTGGWAWKDSSASVGNAGTNSFTAVYTPADTANYNTVEVTVSVAVSKANPTYTVPTGLTATYGQTLADVALTGGWAWKDSSASVGNAGTNSFAAVYTPADTANYNTVEVTVSVAVAKANPSYTVPTGLTATYGDTLADVALPEGFSWKDSSLSVGNVGTNSFTAVYDNGDANYNTVELQVSVTVAEPPSVDKFAVSLYDDDPAFLYRVGNSNTVALGSLFKALDGAEIGNVTVTVTAVDGASNVSGTYTANSTDWTAGTLKFTGTGPVQVTIVDDDYCNPLTISLEVVTGYNVTQYSELQNRSSVLLNDITMSDGSAYALTSGTLYGNNFTIDARKAAYTASSSKIEGNYVIRLGNATLDNVQVVGAVYTTYGSTSDSDYNRALVLINGDAMITNCYLSNTTAPVRMYKGSVEIINTTLKGGVFANMDIRAGSVILDNVTTINQLNGTDRAEDGTVVAGLGIVFYYEGTPASTSLEIRNSLTQYNFISQSHGETYIQDDTAKALVDAMFQSKYSAVQYTDASGDTWVNTGILAMIDTINGDNITDIDGYQEMAVSYLGKDGFVSTVQPNQSSIDALVTDYVSAGQYAISPTYSFDYTEKNYVAKTDGSNDYCYYDNGTVLISMDEGDSFAWDTSILTVTKNGQTIPYTVTVDGVDYTNKSITFTDTQECTVVYTYTDPYNYALSGTEVVASGKTYEKTVQISVTAVPPAAKDAVFTFYGYNAISQTAASTYSDTTTVTADSKTYIMPATADANVKTTTIGGVTINCPVVYVDFKDNASDFNWLYPVFLGVQIQDFADGGAGDGYVVIDPRSTTKPENLTIITTDSGWSAGSGQSGSEGTLTSGTYNGLYGWTGGALGSDKSESTLIAQFSYKDNKGSVYYYCIAFYRAAHTCPSCVTGDTLITLADGSQVRVDSLTGSEELLVWNLETGMLDSAPVMFVDSEEEKQCEIVHLYFSDGTDVKVIYEHGFWDYDLNRYVYLDKDAANYIGHTFAKQNGDTLDKVQLTNVVIEHAVTTAWSPVTAGHLCYFVNGMLSMPGGIGGLFNIFDVNAQTMTYDWDAMARDIETYGLFAYEELNAIQPLPEAMFEAAGGAYLKVSIGKGNLTMEELIAMIQRYTKYF